MNDTDPRPGPATFTPATSSTSCAVEHGALAAFLEALAEFDRRSLFRDLGHP